MPPAGSRRGRVRRGKLKMVEALPLRAMRFNHEITAASMAKQAGRYDFRPFGLASSVMVNAAFRPLTPCCRRIWFPTSKHRN
jgi:hypothetical protein